MLYFDALKNELIKAEVGIQDKYEKTKYQAKVLEAKYAEIATLPISEMKFVKGVKFDEFKYTGPELNELPHGEREYVNKSGKVYKGIWQKGK